MSDDSIKKLHQALDASTPPGGLIRHAAYEGGGVVGSPDVIKRLLPEIELPSGWCRGDACICKESGADPKVHGEKPVPCDKCGGQTGIHQIGCPNTDTRIQFFDSLDEES